MLYSDISSISCIAISSGFSTYKILLPENKDNFISFWYGYFFIYFHYHITFVVIELFIVFLYYPFKFHYSFNFWYYCVIFLYFIASLARGVLILLIFSKILPLVILLSVLQLCVFCMNSYYFSSSIDFGLNLHFLVS